MKRGCLKKMLEIKWKFSEIKKPHNILHHYLLA